MKISKKQKLVALSVVTLGIVGVAFGAFPVANALQGSVEATTETYKMTIDKTSDAKDGKVTARTDRGNTSIFSYNRFDTRNGDTVYNDCICFYKVDNDLGGYITNDVAIAGIKTVNIYNYPVNGGLAGGEFNLYYGYDNLIIDHSNTARVSMTGTYTFEAGLEPSFIAIETTTTFDYCVDKVEIIFNCAPVEGTTTDHKGPAYRYDYVGKEFETKTGVKVPYNVTESSPWAHADLRGADHIKSAHGNNTGYDGTTFTVNEDGSVTLKGYYNNGILIRFADVSKGRPILSFTIKPGSWTWGGPAFYFSYTKANGVSAPVDSSPMHIYNTAGVADWYSKGGKIYDENDNFIKTNTLQLDVFYRFEIDLTEWLGDCNLTVLKITNDYSDDDSGSSYAHVPTTILKDVSFKTSFCGCATTVEEKYSDGTDCGTRCATCKTVLSNNVDALSYYCPDGHEGIFTYETGVTFDGRENCLKTTTTAYTNNEEMGWTTNYKIYFKNLVKNARAASTPLIKLHLYVESSVNDNMRFGWGVGNNKSGAQADHCNGASTLLVGTNDVANNSTLTLENGTASKLPANTWVILTVDVSGDFFAKDENADFYITCNLDANKDRALYPISTYISSISLSQAN